ncbi:MAG TPA: signal peptidase I [Bacilli bacterium]|jgi:signal peptidase I|nr:signal peptidase I [Bacilli bacterium]
MKTKVNSEIKEEHKVEEDTKKARKDIFLDYAPYVIIILFVIIIRLFICTPVQVSGTSMYPTLHDGDIMLLYKLRKRIVGINRFDIVVIKTDSGKLIKRVIGLPGETIKYAIELNDNDDNVGVLYVNGEKISEDFLSKEASSLTCTNNPKLCSEGITIPDNEYFVMGDNRGNSKDSRIIGTVSYDDIMGNTSIILFPFTRIGNVNK